jgi:hypothetical protein
MTKKYPIIKSKYVETTFFLKDDEEKLYKSYIDEHRSNVAKFWNRLHPKCKGNFRFDDYYMHVIDGLIMHHDISKYTSEEFHGYRQYFYPRKGEQQDKYTFNMAWNFHQKANMHHWEYWVIPNDAILPMPFTYIIEMLCDWGAMSIKFNNKISDWYNENKEYMLLHEKTIKHIEKWMPLVDSCIID